MFRASVGAKALQPLPSSLRSVASQAHPVQVQRMRMKMGFAKRLDDLANVLWKYSVQKGRDSNGSHITIGFGDPDTLHLVWLEILCLCRC